MAKVDIEIVQKILKESGVDVRMAAEILNQIRDAVAEEAVEREKPAKKQMLVLVSEPEEGLPKDLTGWVVQLLEDDDPKEVADKIVDVAKAFNESPKGQRMPVESFGDAVQSISSKLYRESDLWIKTREPDTWGPIMLPMSSGKSIVTPSGSVTTVLNSPLGMRPKPSRRSDPPNNDRTVEHPANPTHEASMSASATRADGFTSPAGRAVRRGSTSRARSSSPPSGTFGTARMP
ncbi:MAG: hypothetical protein EB132_05895 [Actinobacteria bacterium]|nr:hypothetical protein [Actinomycetota bacterium]